MRLLSQFSSNEKSQNWFKVSRLLNLPKSYTLNLRSRKRIIAASQKLKRGFGRYLCITRTDGGTSWRDVGYAI